MSPPVLSLFWCGGVIELVAGALIVLGLFSRCAAFVASGEMAVAYFPLPHEVAGAGRSTPSRP